MKTACSIYLLAILTLGASIFGFTDSYAQQEIDDEPEGFDLKELKDKAGDHLIYLSKNIYYNELNQFSLIPGEYKLVFRKYGEDILVKSPSGKEIHTTNHSGFISFHLSTGGFYSFDVSSSAAQYENEWLGSLFLTYDPYFSTSISEDYLDSVNEDRNKLLSGNFSVMFFYDAFLEAEDKEVIASLNKLKKEYDDKNVNFYFVSRHSRSWVTKFINAYNFEFIPIPDFSKYKLQYLNYLNTPRFIILNPEGETLFWHLSDFVNIYDLLNSELSDLKLADRTN